MKNLMVGLLMTFAVIAEAADGISVTREEISKKVNVTHDDRYVFVTNKIDKTGPVKGKIGNHYVKIAKEKYSSPHLLIFADGSVQTSDLNLKEPCLICYVLSASKQSGKKYIRVARLTSERKWKSGCYCESGSYRSPKEYSKGRVEVSASLWRAYRSITTEDCRDYVDLGMDEAVICYRMELWQDGKLLDVKDTSKLSTLCKLGLDFEWYVDGKNEGKIVR